jgi:hypothetical protein
MRQSVRRIRNEPHIVSNTDYTIGRSTARIAIQCRLELLSERSSRDCPDHSTDSCPTRACISYHPIICRPPDRCIPAGNVPVMASDLVSSIRQIQISKFNCAYLIGRLGFDQRNHAKPVIFGEHRMMLRPRDSHDLRLLAATLTIDPASESLRWLHDVFGNSVAVASFTQQAAVLKIESLLDLEHFESDEPDCPIETYAATYPFAYSAEEVPDLHRSIERQYPDEFHEVDLWAKRFVNSEGETNTLAMLTAMTQAIKSEFNYAVRLAEGCQLPVETLNLKSGSCCDFALLMMEAVRALRLAARFALDICTYLRPTMATERWAAARLMPGCRSTCPARAGWSSTPLTAWSEIAI